MNCTRGKGRTQSSQLARRSERMVVVRKSSSDKARYRSGNSFAAIHT